MDFLLGVDFDSEGNTIFVGNTIYPVRDIGVSGQGSLYPGPFYDTDADFIEFQLLDAYDSSYNGFGDSIIIKTNTTGEIIWSSYFGGTKEDRANDVVIDNDDNVIVVGKTRSTNLPRLNAFDPAFDGNMDGFIAKFTPTGELLFATYFGGSGSDQINAVASDSQNNIIIIGGTSSSNLPTLNPIDDEYNGGRFSSKAFISKFSPEGDLLWSTYFGGNGYDNDYTVEIDDNDNIVLAGLTKSDDFPVYNSNSTEFAGKADAFLVKISSSGDLVFSTFLGGLLIDWIQSMTLDGENNVIITGYTDSVDYPTLDGQDDIINNGPQNGLRQDVFVTKFSPQGEVMWSPMLVVLKMKSENQLQ